MITVYIDGGSRKNPGEAAIGFVVYDENGVELARGGRRLGVASNNAAEYYALMEALQFVEKNFTSEDVLICTDSELVTKQVHGEYRVKSSSLAPLFNEVQKALKRLPRVRLKHIGRDRNKTADWIVNRVLDGIPIDS